MEALITKAVTKEVSKQIKKAYNENRKLILIILCALSAVILSACIVLTVVKLVNKNKATDTAEDIEDTEDAAEEEEEDEEDFFEEED